MKRKLIGKIVFVDGKNKYISGKELEDYEAEERQKKRYWDIRMIEINKKELEKKNKK